MVASKLVRLGLWIFAATVVALVGLRALSAWAGDAKGTRLGASGLDAEWIWADGAAEEGRAVAFWAVRDVWLEDVDEPVWLSVVADAEYVAWIDGQRVGSGCWRPHRAIDRYDVTSLLEPGMSRIAIEVRSPRGAGGLLAALRRELDDRVETITGTDASWWIVRRERPELLFGLSTPEALGGTPPRVWGAPPTGRWRPTAGAPVATEVELAAELDGDRERYLRPVAVRHATARRVRWVDLRERSRLPRIDRQVIFDFGEVVEGHLEVGLACAVDDEVDSKTDDSPSALEPTPPALLFFGEEAPAVRGAPVDAVLVAPEGACTWRDAKARRFRYAAVVGLSPKRRVVVDRVAVPGAAAERLQTKLDGVFGLAPARGWSAVEEEVWDRLADRRRARDGRALDGRVLDGRARDGRAPDDSAGRR